MRMTSLTLQGLLCHHALFVIIYSINSQCQIPNSVHKHTSGTLSSPSSVAQTCPPVSAVIKSRGLSPNIFSNKHKVIEIVLAHFFVKGALLFCCCFVVLRDFLQRQFGNNYVLISHCTQLRTHKSNLTFIGPCIILIVE